MILSASLYSTVASILEPSVPSARRQRGAVVSTRCRCSFDAVSANAVRVVFRVQGEEPATGAQGRPRVRSELLETVLSARHSRLSGSESFLYPSVNIVASVPCTVATAQPVRAVHCAPDHYACAPPWMAIPLQWCCRQRDRRVAVLAIGRSCQGASPPLGGPFVWHGAEDVYCSAHAITRRTDVPRDSIVAVLTRTDRRNPRHRPLLRAPTRTATRRPCSMALEANRESASRHRQPWYRRKPEGWYFRIDHLPYHGSIPAATSLPSCM